MSEDEYCNVCENFPCLGNHPPDVIAEALERYERAAAFIRCSAERRYGYTFSSPPGSGRGPGPLPSLGLFRFEAGQAAAQAELRRLAEVQDRIQWTEGIRRRLGLVAEVHRCWVWQGSDKWWHWWCQRDGCYAGEGPLYGSQPDALTDALAHTRSFVPQPPEPEPFPELTREAYFALADGVPAVGAGLDLTGRGPQA